MRTSALLLIAASVACSGPAAERARIEPVYDQKTGRLQLLKHDSDGNGTIDTWGYMDGARTIRVEQDTDGDTRIDRWEYYAPDQSLEKIGVSRMKDGTPDSWAYYGADGALARMEISTARNGTVDRTEFYERGVVVRAEQDTTGNGRLDKWEAYDGGRLVSVLFDTQDRGVPDRRLVYGPDGTARLEMLP